MADIVNIHYRYVHQYTRKKMQKSQIHNSRNLIIRQSRQESVRIQSALCEVVRELISRGLNIVIVKVYGIVVRA